MSAAFRIKQRGFRPAPSYGGLLVKINRLSAAYTTTLRKQFPNVDELPFNYFRVQNVTNRSTLIAVFSAFP